MAQPARESEETKPAQLAEELFKHTDTAAPKVRIVEGEKEFKPPRTPARDERVIRATRSHTPVMRFLDDEPLKDPDDPEFRIPGSFEAHVNAKKHKTEEEIANYSGVVRKNTNAV